MSLPYDAPIFADYEELSQHAQRLHDELAAVRDREKADPSHLCDLSRIRQIAVMDAVLYAYEKWVKG